MKQYLDLITDVMTTGIETGDRTGVGCRAAIGKHFHWDMQNGFPLLTTKRVSFHNILHELLWFISGDTNVKYLHDHGVTIWDEWADANGELGPIYGKQWRSWETSSGKIIDQLNLAVKEVAKKSNSRRIVISAWNPGELDRMALYPCHALFQFHVLGDKVHLTLYQRSGDLFLGVPYNIASYGLLLEMVASVCGMQAGGLHITFGNLHIYKNHYEQIATQSGREPKKLPTLEINKDVTNIFTFEEKDFTLLNYESWPAIKAPVAV